MRLARSLLLIDSRAGLAVGAGMLLLSRWLSRLYGLSHSLVIAMGIANLAYGTYSFVLEHRSERPNAALLLLVAGNAAWGVLCLVAAILLAPFATPLGTAVLVLEGLFVGGLAVLEWRHRETLRVRA
ncbi:MAG: hypothetical protein ACKVS7_14555 [Gemmatimonadaceae bacterium]